MSFTYSVHSTARSLQGFRANRLRLVRSVAIVIGITLSMPMEAVSQASPVPTKSALKTYTRTLLSKEEYRCVNKIWSKESAWNHTADNPHSTAYGIPQILRMKETNPFIQISKGLIYIEHRYKTPCNALRFHLKHGWY